MAKQDKQLFYPLRDAENPTKITLVPISEKVYRAVYPEIWATQKREHSHGRCKCTRKYLWKCDGCCELCEFHVLGDAVSLDDPLPDGNGSLADYIPDSAPLIEDIIADQDELDCLIKRFRELDPEADKIIRMRLENPKISNREIARRLGRPQRTFADQMKRYYTELHKEKE